MREGTEAEGGKGKVYLLTDCMVYEIMSDSEDQVCGLFLYHVRRFFLATAARWCPWTHPSSAPF